MALRADARNEPVSFVVTAEALDSEMTDRIARHRAERPANWHVVEAPRDLALGLADVGLGFVVVDCLSFWVANLVMDDVVDNDHIESVARRVALLLLSRTGSGVVVSNEVGLGLVPDNELGRRFRDVLGRVNAILAASSNKAFLVVAGRTMELSSPPHVD